MRVSVFGTGQWGTVLAQVLSDAGNDVLIWGRNREAVNEINSIHFNSKSLPAVALPEKLRATADAKAAFEHGEIFVLAVPAQSLRANLREWRGFIPAQARFVSAMKGVELSTLKRMTEVIQEILDIPEAQLGILTGPNLAKEVATRQPAGAVAASTSIDFANEIARVFSTSYFRVYTSTDVVGCELASAAKNVIALAVGMATGMGFGDNTQSLVITRGLNEITRLGVARGATTLTFVGLAGVGDLLATCSSSLSRNRSFGEILGKSGSMAKALAEVKSTVEGVPTASAVVELAHSVGIEVPIMESVAAVVENLFTPQEAMVELMKIDTGAEIGTL